MLAILSVQPTTGAVAVGLLSIGGTIAPATADYVMRGIAHSESRGHQLVLLQISAPGGAGRLAAD